MADPATAPPATGDGGATPPAAVAPSTSAPPATGDDDGDLGEPGQRALRELRRINKQDRATIEDLNARLRTFEDAQRSETERLTADRDEWKAKYEAEVVPAKREVLATRIAAEAGLDVDLWSRLKGDTEEELREDAKAMVERFGVAAPSTQPRDLGAGARQPPPATGNEAFNQRLRRGR